MYNRFLPFQSHLDLAHAYWQKIARSGDLVIDATCGNGHDALVLAKLALTREAGKLWAIDLQELALHNSQKLLQEQTALEIYQRIVWVQSSHESFPASIEKESVKLIVYNLGYLPGGDKSVTTQTESTIKSLSHALTLICRGGAISIACYPGHPEGAEEEAALLPFLSELDPREWSVCHHVWRNRKNAPSLLLITRAQASIL